MTYVTREGWKIPPTFKHVIGETQLYKAFQLAKYNGIARPSIRVADYFFKEAPATGKNPGWIYIHIKDDFIGKMNNKEMIITGQCDDYQRNVIFMILDKPAYHLEVHGRKTGNCGICNRPLTNQESITRGIGPTCAEKMGFL